MGKTNWVIVSLIVMLLVGRHAYAGMAQPQKLCRDDPIFCVNHQIKVWTLGVDFVQIQMNSGLMNSFFKCKSIDDAPNERNSICGNFFLCFFSPHHTNGFHVLYWNYEAQCDQHWFAWKQRKTIIQSSIHGLVHFNKMPQQKCWGVHAYVEFCLNTNANSWTLPNVCYKEIYRNSCVSLGVICQITSNTWLYGKPRPILSQEHLAGNSRLSFPAISGILGELVSSHNEANGSLSQLERESSNSQSGHSGDGGTPVIRSFYDLPERDKRYVVGAHSFALVYSSLAHISP